MFVERKVRYSALFTSLVGWHASAVSFPLSVVILAKLACPLSDIMFCLHSGITNLSLYKHLVQILPLRVNKWQKIIIILLCPDSAVVEHLVHKSKIKGSDPATGIESE
jgi:hypothetical protein